jgi:hypothetical protein
MTKSQKLKLAKLKWERKVLRGATLTMIFDLLILIVEEEKSIWR